MSLIKSFKRIDAYKQPVNLLLTLQDKRKNSKQHKEKLGSIIGAILTSMSITMCFMYMGYLSYRMFALQEDILKSQTITNTFEDQYSEVTIQDEHFLPSLEIEFLPSYDSRHQILRKDGAGKEERQIIDLERLKDYFLIEISCRYREKGKSRYVNYPVK